LWKFNTSTNAWTLVYNTTSAPVYTKSSTATPGVRANATLWVDERENVWIYGGSMDYYDFWQFNKSNGWVWKGGNHSFALAVFPPGVAAATPPSTSFLCICTEKSDGGGRGGDG
jgi:hypothetical protein